LGDDGITWPEGGNINMMHGDSRVMVVVCLATTSLPAPCLSTSTFPGSREEPFFMQRQRDNLPPTLPPTAIAAPIPPLRLTTAIFNQRLPHR
ncbi:hypothetical protein SJR91_21455, partial [Aeromonas caviae]|uniref:hypothetical protein n=1 Tax=Aeromonas caviae TaxID=648 RepID=UPI0029DBD7AE